MTSTPSTGMAGIRARTLDELDALTGLAATPSARARFVFAHVPVPHWPFVFDSQCGPAVPSGEVEGGSGRHAGTPVTVAAAVSQTMCVDRLVSDAVAKVIRAEPDAVVIVMSDHGPEEFLDWSAPNALGIWERSANLFAARTPGRTDVFPDDLLLVNLIPTLFNAYLGTELPMQPAEYWYGPRPQDSTFIRVDPKPQH